MAEKLVKVEGTSGAISDIVIDSKGTWYIVKNKKLHYTFDKGITCHEIELPSRQDVLPFLGLDRFGNIYVQDLYLKVYLVAPSEGRSFSFEKIKLAFGDEKIVSRPFHEGNYNDVYLTTKSGLMSLKNGYRECKEAFSLPHSKGFSRCVPLSSALYTNGKFFSGGGTRYWIYRLSSDQEPQPIHQTKSVIRHMDGGYRGVFFIVNGESGIHFIDDAETPNVTKVAGIDDSTLRDLDFYKFVAYSPKKDSKTYIYCHFGKTATIYELGERKFRGKLTYEVVSQVELPSVYLLCCTSTDGRLFFGTSDGIYELVNIGPKRVVDEDAEVRG